MRHGMGQPHLPARTARAHAAQCRCDSVPRATATVQRYSLTANGSLSAETSRNFARQCHCGSLSDCRGHFVPESAGGWEAVGTLSTRAGAAALQHVLHCGGASARRGRQEARAARARRVRAPARRRTTRTAPFAAGKSARAAAGRQAQRRHAQVRFRFRSAVVRRCMPLVGSC